MRHRILCMYSGGIDSTAVLYKLLTDMKYISYDIHVHHISLINIENKHDAELVAVSNCLKWFKKKIPNRKILFTKNIVDFNFLQPIFPLDSDIFSFVAGQIFRSCNPSVGMNVKYDFFATGLTNTDIIGALDYTNSKEIKNEIVLSDDKKKYTFTASSRTNKIIDACISPLETEKLNIEAPERLYPLIDLDKKDVIKIIPEDLLKLTWSCRTPINKNNKYYECNKCKSCKEKTVALKID